ncbi:MAG: hypothetical protein EBS05_22390 [Proteobacteria bacterium]|nr:hypothetical protein [Pseudomonadota bacterium]
MLYVLSVGPMIALALRGVIPNELADYFCRPASWFAISTGTASAMNSYVVAWHNLTGTEY